MLDNSPLRHRQPNEASVSTAVADYDLVITRLVDAPRDVVFNAWTNPALAIQLWGPKDFVITELELDPRPGGAWHARMRSPQGDEYPQSGVMRDVVPFEHIAFTFVWEDEPADESLVEVTFADRGDTKTEFTFHQSPFKSAELRDSHRDGWNECFDRLDAFLTSNRR